MRASSVPEDLWLRTSAHPLRTSPPFRTFVEDLPVQHAVKRRNPLHRKHVVAPEFRYPGVTNALFQKQLCRVPCPRVHFNITVPFTDPPDSSLADLF